MKKDLETPLSRSRLETLSTAELIKLSDSYGIDIPPQLDRIFIIEELCNCFNEENKEPTEDIQIDPSYSETAALPKQYNISYIDIMIRDPLWIFAFWEIKEHDKQTYENSPDFDGYFLRVIPVNEEAEETSAAKEKSFTIPVDTDDNARYLGFAEHSALASDRYIVKLGVKSAGTEHQLAASLPFQLPRLVTNKDICAMKENALVRLSGAQDLPIIIDKGQ